MKHTKKYTYYQKLILIFSVSILIVVIPYILLLYHTSNSKLLISIQRTNNQNLVQIKSDYDSFTETMKNICFSIYLNQETQQLLYNSDISYQESNAYINYLKSTFFNIYPSMYAISIYNAGEDKFYSTLSEPSAYLADLSKFIQNTEEFPKLHPILRKVPHINGKSYIYVLSYITYDFKDRKGKPSSFIIIDQNASWLIDSFTKSNQVGEELSSRLYLLDSTGKICSQDTDTISDTDKKLIKKYTAEHADSGNHEEAFSYIDTLQRSKYLMTGLQLNTNSDSLVMIQNYDDVFSDLESFQFTFRMIAIIGLALLILIITITARRIYAPVKKTLNYIGDLTGHSFQTNENEFQQLIHLYKESHDKLTSQTHNTRRALKHYRLEKLLTDNTSAALNDFRAFAPEHWLCGSSSGCYRLLLITINKETFLEDGMSPKDFDLLLFAVQNIFTELFEKEYPAEVFTTAENSIWAIMQTSSEDYDLVLEDVIASTKTHTNKFIETSFDVTYSRTITDPAELHTLYQELLQLHHYHYVYGPDAVINPLTCQKNLENNEIHIPENLEKKFANALKCEHTEQSLDLLSEIFKHLRQMKYENIQVCILAFANLLIFTLKEICTAKQLAAKIHFEQVYQKLENASYLEEFETFLTEYIQHNLNLLLEKQELDKHQLFVKEIQDYIAEHYADPNLSSQNIGEHLNLTSKYVMKKFQDYAGISLNDYITEVRMKQAALLLTECKMSVSKVAQQVGILNENYFYRLFKKVYACTPREFSSRNSSENS